MAIEHAMLFLTYYKQMIKKQLKKQSATLNSAAEHDNTTLHYAYVCITIMAYIKMYSDYPYIERENASNNSHG